MPGYYIYNKVMAYMRHCIKWIAPCAGILIILITLTSCEREDPFFRTTEPRVKMKLIPAGAKIKLDTLIVHNVDSLEKTYQALATTIDPDKKQALQQKLAGLKTDSTQLAEKVEIFDDGRVPVSRIVGLGGNENNYFQDSLVTTFGLPLRVTADTATYFFFYDDLVDTLQLTYKRNVIQTIDGIRYQIFDLTESQSTFDSLKIICKKRNCSNNESTIEAYF